MATATDGKLPPASTATQRQAYARYIYGFDAVNTGASKSYPSEQHTIFALQLLQLFAEHIGLPKVKDRRMMPRFASLPTIVGRPAEVSASLFAHASSALIILAPGKFIRLAHSHRKSPWL